MRKFRSVLFQFPKGTTLVEILVAMTLLAGLVLPLALTGIKFASGHMARLRLEHQFAPNEQLGLLRQFQYEPPGEKLQSLLFHVDTVKCQQRLFERRWNEAYCVELVTPIADR